MLTLLGVTNVAQGATSAFPQLTAEAVIDANPNVVLLTDAEFGESFETVAARPGWSGVSAVVDQRVFPLDPDLVNRPGPRIVDGLETMARLIYPDLFQ
jgi:iron complex transport system substrate-binding protein